MIKEYIDFSKYNKADMEELIYLVINTYKEIYGIDETAQIIDTWMGNTEYIKGYCRT